MPTTLARHRRGTRRPATGAGGAVIRVQMIRSDTRHPDRRRRHQGRANCEVAGGRFEAEGPAPIYKLTTLLWLHGLGGADFEVWDDVSPTGKPGGLAMRGRVRNWARLVKGEPIFTRDAPPEADFSLQDRDMIAQTAGQVVDVGHMDSPRHENGHTARSRPLDGPGHQPEPEGPSPSVIGPRATEAA